MSPLVTIGIPIYKRLEYLPNVLNVVARQDYPKIELLVSDNGMNGFAVPEIVNQYYVRPFKFRQNSATVSISSHFNQIINEASGEYFLLLADDDEISSNYVSEMVNLLERYPRASAAMAIQETIDESGALIRRSKPMMPDILSGIAFVRAAWGTHEYNFESFSTFLAKTEKLRACGGYPDFWKGHGNDDALLTKLCLDNHIVLSTQCSFRKRFYESSHGYALPIQDLAKGIRDFLQFLNSDQTMLSYARSNPVEWSEARRYLVEMAWKTYFSRWTGMYRDRLTAIQWIRAAFALPFIPDYYRAVRSTLIWAPMAATLAPIQKYLPGAYDLYRCAKKRYQRATR